LDRELVYIQKIYFLLFLWFCNLVASAIAIQKLGISIGIIFGLFGFIISYLIAIRKKSFPAPDKKLTAQRMAREISHDTSPLTIARFASQLYFYLNDPQRAISLLEKYLPTQDPLVCATLGDIYLRENRPHQALAIIRENPYALVNPLLLAVQGHAYRRLGKTRQAIKIYERCLRLAHKNGFPHSGANRLTQWLLNMSYTASIHHALGDCYMSIGQVAAAKKHYRSGNLRLIDVTMWRFTGSAMPNSPEKYSKSH